MYQGMTQEEKSQLLEQINQASEADDMETFLRLSKEMPVPPFIAMAFRKSFGAEFLLKSGFNLSEAEQEYGKDWLSR